MAVTSSRFSSSWSTSASCISGEKCRRVPLPLAFASYIATSAFRSSVSTCSDSPGRARAMPMLVLMVKRPMRQLSLELLALTHVSDVHDDPADVGTVEQVRARCLDLECSKRRQQFELERRRRAVVPSRFKSIGYPRTVIVDHELE